MEAIYLRRNLETLINNLLSKYAYFGDNKIDVAITSHFLERYIQRGVDSTDLSTLVSRLIRDNLARVLYEVHLGYKKGEDSLTIRCGELTVGIYFNILEKRILLKLSSVYFGKPIRDNTIEITI